MNTKIKVVALGCLLAASAVSADTFSSTNVLTIPNGNPTGIMDTISVSNVAWNIANIQISLDIAGGYNGSLYATLTGPSGQKAVLLNRVGVSSTNTFGFADAGINLTLDDGVANSGNIHGYGNGSYSLNGNGQVTGTWGADGRDIDPQSSPATFDSAATLANLSLFTGSDANGSWTLFVGNLVGGGGAPATLNGWSLDITPVPEPATGALLGLSALALLGWWKLSRRSRSA